MYTTKPLSLFKSYPEAASQAPPEGQNSGYLVVDDADDETCCWGTACCPTRVWGLPFPQNRVLTVAYSDGSFNQDVVFVPVPDQPITSNRYYAVIAWGSRKGRVVTCSREEDTTTCFCRCIKDVNPRPFDPADIYQQIEVVQRKRGLFTARAVAADGFPPVPYRYKDWHLHASKNKKLDLREALGLDDALRSRQLCHTGSPVVGRWYCPFYLIKEDGVSPRKQMGRSAFYEVVLEQHWEPVDALCGSSTVSSRKVLVGGSMEAAQESAGSSRHGDAYLWFGVPAMGQRLGLCTSVWERLRWEENRGGWVDEEEDAGKVAGGLVLVERFVFKRMDGSVAISFDFVQLNKARGKQP